MSRQFVRYFIYDFVTSTRVNRRSERVGDGRSSNARRERGMTAVRIIQFGTIAEEAKEKLRKLDIVNFCFSTGCKICDSPSSRKLLCFVTTLRLCCKVISFYDFP